MAFNTALSGLNAASTDLAVTGNNIANAGTNGFKQSRAEFVDLFASSFQGVNSVTPGTGVRVANIAQQFTQGNVEFTENNLDLAINGDGFFVLSDNGGIEYTRAGAYTLNRDGYVVNSSGQRLQVFPPVTVGTLTTFNTGALSDLQLTTNEAPPRATTSVLANLNLDATATRPVKVFDPAQPDTFNHSTSMTVYDSLGAPHTGTLYFVSQYDGVDPATANTWNSYFYVDGVNVGASGGAATTAPDSIALEFNSDGTLANVGGASPATGIFTFDPFGATVGGANPLALEFDFSQSTQFGGNFNVNNLSQDGFTTGRLIGIEVASNGIFFARFSNGQSQELGQIALAKFANSQGLAPLGNSNWAETFESGDATLGAPITSNLGSIQSGALEGSNVDIAEQLVKLIVAQRNFQANAQSISTEDQITQTIINIR